MKNKLLKRWLFSLELASAFPSGALTNQPEISKPFIAFSNGNDNKPVVHAERRRRAESTGERAEAPQREGSGGPPPSSGGPGGTGGGMGLPSFGGRLGGSKGVGSLALLLIIACLYFGIQMFGGGTSVTPSDQNQLNQPTEPFSILPVEPTQAPLQISTPRPQATATKATKPTSAPAAAPGAAGGQKWLVMLYQDADDKVLEQDIYVDLNEAERVGSSDQVTIVAQLDRYRAGYQGDGDWVTAKRFYVTQDDDLNQVGSQQVADLGEVNMADANTLIDFVEWALQSYPADRYVLVLSDHGMGWPGGWTDADPKGRGDPRIPLASKIGDMIYLNKLDALLGKIRQDSGIDKFDIIGMDACLMSQMEVYAALAPHAHYAVASEEVEPALGWAYASFLGALAKNPGMQPSELASLIVKSYITDDERIVDPQARAEMLRQSSGFSGMFGTYGSVSPQQLASQMGQDGTLTAVDLGQYPGLLEQLNSFSYALQGDSQALVAKARAYTQSFTSIFGTQVPASYIDLGHFAALMAKNSSDKDVVNQGKALLEAIQNTVVAEKHGPKKPAATGIAIYFPNSDLYRTAEAGPRSYTAIADRFADESLWDNFMAFHYAGKVFEPQVVSRAVPESGAAIRGPGASAIQLSAVQASKQSVSIGDTATLSADVSGENIGYAYLFVGYYDKASNSINVADMDYLESTDTRELNGVYYPEWGSNDFILQFDWEPVVFAIDDGDRRVAALFKPQSYGKSFEEAVYAVDGTYTFADSGDQQRARMLFSDGNLQRVLGFFGDPDAAAPYEIIPNPGDQFTVSNQWMELDPSGNVSKIVDENGKTVTFGKQSFRYVQLDAAAGSYVVGFILSNLDGQSFQTFTPVIVR